jgi:hypothetical protein
MGVRTNVDQTTAATMTAAAKIMATLAANATFSRRLSDERPCVAGCSRSDVGVVGMCTP